MSAGGELIEVVLDDGVVSFDGRVVESFGFGEHQAIRLHIAKIKKLELKAAGKRAMLQVKARTGGNINAYCKPDAAQLAELERLVEAIRAAAPGV